jgi:hypothetical protein
MKPAYGSMALLFALLALSFISANVQSATTPTSAAETTLTPFGVKDSVENNLIIGIHGGDANPVQADLDIALYAPDRSHFIIRTRRGDIGNNTVIQSLYLFVSRDVAAYLAGELRSAPQPRLLTMFNVRDDNDRIHSIHWLSNEAVGFIGPDMSRIMQAWSVNIDERKLIQLTHSATNVNGFAATTDKVIYFADLRPTRLAPTYVSRPFREYYYEQVLRSMLPYWEDRKTRAVHRIGNTPFSLSPECLGIWPSPDGQMAISMQPVQNPPTLWAAYMGRTPGAGFDSNLFQDKSLYNDPTSQNSFFTARFVILDLKAGTIRSLLDAPSGYSAHTASYLSFNVWWIKNQQAVIIANTYLPLNVSDPKEVAQRSREPGIAEVKVGSGAVTPIARLPLLKAGESEVGDLRQEVSWDRATGTLSLSNVSGAGTTTEKYQTDGTQWRTAGVVKNASRGLSVAVSQNLELRPKLVVRDQACNCQKALFDPDPGLDKFSFGHAEIVNWSGPPNGSWTGKWQGELIYPVGYSSGKRYPLVVLTHGAATNTGEFLIDGPGGITTAMPAQALANSGIMVLQVFDQNCFTTDRKESFVCAAGYKDGIQSLIDRGLVDGRNVGLIAFSRTGVEAGRLLAQYPDLLAAIDISDAVWWGYVMHTLFFPEEGDEATLARKLTSGLDHRESISDAQNDPLYKWSESRAAIRMEGNGHGAVIGMWEALSMLRAAKHPVEALYLPNALHKLYMPDERMASQGGNVDWFRFWLQDYEDPDPNKRDQYERWRALRQMRDAKRVDQ